jgi:very-short-patch-repair endonuclease
LPGAISFLKTTGNLFNVAITRAKSTLIIIGDEESCLHSGVSYLEHFVAYVRKSEKNTFTSIDFTKDYGLEYPTLDSRFSVSEWEKILYTALYKSGIKTHPQYSIDKYYLDLALFHNGKCLDIEVDGERYHRSWNGELCYRDQLRNQRMFELGWDVKRFWVYEIRDNLPWCIEQIKAWMNKV